VQHEKLAGLLGMDISWMNVLLFVGSIIVSSLIAGSIHAWWEQQKQEKSKRG